MSTLSALSAALSLPALFAGSVLASTLLPGGVEVLLYAMVKAGHASLPLLITATIGNTLGGVITYAVGVLLRRGVSNLRRAPRWQRAFSLRPAALARVRRFGLPCLLLSWLPVVGDPLCLAAGYLRLAFWRAALMIGIGKFLRYLALLWLIGWQ